MFLGKFLVKPANSLISQCKPKSLKTIFGYNLIEAVRHDQSEFIT